MSLCVHLSGVQEHSHLPKEQGIDGGEALDDEGKNVRVVCCNEDRSCGLKGCDRDWIGREPGLNDGDGIKRALECAYTVRGRQEGVKRPRNPTTVSEQSSTNSISITTLHPKFRGDHSRCVLASSVKLGVLSANLNSSSVHLFIRLSVPAPARFAVN